MAGRFGTGSLIGQLRCGLKMATAEIVDREISRAYEQAKDAGEKPPNIREVLAPVRASLAVLGYFASKAQIKEVAGNEKHAAQRLPRGRIPAGRRV
jgi:hypothetical protein